MWKKLRQMLSKVLGTATAAPSRNQPGRRRFRPGIEYLEGRAVPATFTVRTTLDVVAADGLLSLREAISAANAHNGADTVVLPAGLYRLSLRGADDTNAGGDLDVSGTTVFRGAGAGATFIDGQRIDRVFDVLGTDPSSIQVTFQGLTVRNGLADDGGGGGIRVGNADLLVRDCAVTGNRTSGFGGGISNAALPETGNVTVVRSTIARNVAGEGGGLAVLAGPATEGSVLTVRGSTIHHNLANGGGGIFAVKVNLTNSTVSSNTATLDGGGIFTNTANLTNCIVSGNHSTNLDGGGLFATTANLTNCTVSGNSAGGDGGGIAAGTADLTNSTVSGNSALSFGGGLSTGDATLTNSTVSGNSAASGGGLEAVRTATLNGSTIKDNSASNDGGGIKADTAMLTNCTVSGNRASTGGGVFADTTATLTNSSVRGNSSSGDGGGIRAVTATLTSSTVSGNHASNAGGGIAAAAADLTNSTVSGNSAVTLGGGVHAGSITLLNVTVTDNSAHGGGGLFFAEAGTTSVRNSIIAENLADLDGDGPDVSGDFTSGGHNIIGDGSSSTGFVDGTNGDMVGTADSPIDPRLGALANNGGPTRTHALLPGSPAIDTGDNTDAPATDQRGLARSQDGDGNGSRIVDIGALER